VTPQERGCIAVFAKPPRPGQAKTRLAPELGYAGAAALARAFFLDTWATVTRLSWAEAVLATTDAAASEWSFLDRSRVWSQGDGSLGHRLGRILGRALEQFPFAIAIGTDSPGLPTALLEAARGALRESDAVLGPSDDGGFYLIGLRRSPPDLLTDLPWSAPDTFDATLRRLDSLGLDTTVLPPWFDVDRPDDLRRLRRLVGDGTVWAPETARALLRQSGAEASP
jgi:rSAM/selenodomain-associated transferase 1